MGKMTVMIAHSVKLEVSTKLYNILKDDVEREKMSWAELGVEIHVDDRDCSPFKTVVISGQNVAEVVKARSGLEDLFREIVSITETRRSGIPHLLMETPSQQQKLKAIEELLKVAIITDKTKRRLRFKDPRKSSTMSVR